MDLLCLLGLRALLVVLGFAWFAWFVETIGFIVLLACLFLSPLMAFGGGVSVTDYLELCIGHPVSVVLLFRREFECCWLPWLSLWCPQDSLLPNDSLSESEHSVKEINYMAVLKAVWAMCLVETLVFVMTFS